MALVALHTVHRRDNYQSNYCSYMDPDYRIKLGYTNTMHHTIYNCLHCYLQAWQPKVEGHYAYDLWSVR